MSQEKQNEFTFCGIVDEAPNFQFTTQGTCKGRLKVKRTETWSGASGEGSKDIFLSFSLFGKPAEAAMNANLTIGTAVRVVGSFGSWEAKNKEGVLMGFHNPDLKAFRVDVRSEQPSSQKTDAADISF